MLFRSHHAAQGAREVGRDAHAPAGHLRVVPAPADDAPAVDVDHAAVGHPHHDHLGGIAAHSDAHVRQEQHRVARGLRRDVLDAEHALTELLAEALQGGVGVLAQARARQAQAATENRYRDLFDNLPTSLVLHRRGRVIEANRAASDLFGLPAARLAGQPAVVAIDGASRPAVEELLSAARASGKPAVCLASSGPGATTRSTGSSTCACGYSGRRVVVA